MPAHPPRSPPGAPLPGRGSLPPRERGPRRAPVPRGTTSRMTLLKGVPRRAVPTHRSLQAGQRRGWDLPRSLVTPPHSHLYLLGSPPRPPPSPNAPSPALPPRERRISGFALPIKGAHLRGPPPPPRPRRRGAGGRLGGGGWGRDVPPPLRREVISRLGSLLWMLGSSEAGAPETHGLRRERLSRGSPLITLSLRSQAAPGPGAGAMHPARR